MKRNVLLCFIFYAAFFASILQGCSKSNSDMSINAKEAVQQMKAVDVSMNIEKEKEQKSSEESILKGKIICIDPGHQSKANSSKEPIAPSSKITKEKVSSGTIGVVSRVPEYKLSLAVALMVRNKLQAHGAKVIMTREENDVNISNVERAKIANSNKANLCIRIHADGTGDKKARGASVLYPGGKYIKDGKMLSQSKSAAMKVSESIRALTKAKKVKLIERNDLTGFNWSTVPVILVEMGFMTNPDEDRLMQTEAYRIKLADGMVQGIKEYFAALENTEK